MAKKKKPRARNRPSQRPTQKAAVKPEDQQENRGPARPSSARPVDQKTPAKKLSSAEQRAAARKAARRRKQIIYWSVSGVAIVALLAFVLLTKQGSSGSPAPAGTASATPAQAASTPLRVGDTLPSFSAKGLPGTAYANKTVTQDVYKGKRALVTVWAPWCPHCQKELPLLGRLLPQYPGATVATIETGAGAKPGPTPQKLIADSKLTSIPTAWDDSNTTLATAFGVDAFPVVFVVDDTGKIVSAWQGDAPQSWWVQALNYTKGIGTPPPSVTSFQ